MMKNTSQNRENIIFNKAFSGTKNDEGPLSPKTYTEVNWRRRA